MGIDEYGAGGFQAEVGGQFGIVGLYAAPTFELIGGDGLSVLGTGSAIVDLTLFDRLQLGAGLEVGAATGNKEGGVIIGGRGILGAYPFVSASDDGGALHRLSIALDVRVLTLGGTNVGPGIAPHMTAGWAFF